MDPRVVAGEAGGPDHRIDVELAVLEGHRRARGSERAAVERDVGAGPRTDQRLAVLEALPESRVGSDPHHAERVEEAEHVDAQDALREPRLARAHRQVNLRASPPAPRRSGSRCCRRRRRAPGPRAGPPGSGIRRCGRAARSAPPRRPAVAEPGTGRSPPRLRPPAASGLPAPLQSRDVPRSRGCRTRPAGHARTPSGNRRPRPGSGSGPDRPGTAVQGGSRSGLA